MTTIDAIQRDVSEVRLRLQDAVNLADEELETLLVRLELLRLQMEPVHKEGEAALTLAQADLRELEEEAALRGLSE